MTLLQTNPRGPIQRADRSSLLLAMLSLPCGVFGLSWLRVDQQIAREGFPITRSEIEFLSILSAQLPLGVLLLVFAYYLNRRRSWEVTPLLTIAALDEAMALWVLVLGFSYASPLWVLIGLFLLVAIGQFIYHLWLCYPAIRGEDNCAGRGFEPIMPPRQPNQRQNDAGHGP
jgi:hypothetical protein